MPFSVPRFGPRFIREIFELLWKESALNFKAESFSSRERCQINQQLLELVAEFQKAIAVTIPLLPSVWKKHQG